MDDGDSLYKLRSLDEATEWECVGEVCEADGERASPSVDPMSYATVGADDDDEETIDNILDCVSGMQEDGLIQDIIVIVNTTDDEMILFTDLERNDVIMGRLTVAPLNWWETQKRLQMEGGEE